MSRPRRRRKPRAGAARYAAPAAFLLAVTIAVLLIRAGLNGDNTPATTGSTTTTAPTTSTAKGTTTGHTKTTAAQYYTVQSGDTYGSISAKTGVPVSQLESLNPDVSSNSLQVGQRVRVK